MLTIVNTKVLYTWNLLRVNHKCSQHIHIKKMVTMKGDRHVSLSHCGSHFTVYTYIKISYCIP